MNAINIVIVSSSFGILIGFIAGIGYMMFGKNGWLEIRAGLKAERAENERLRELLSEQTTFAVKDQDYLKISTDGAGEGERVSGQVDTALSSSFAWVCDKRGHRFFQMIHDGHTFEICNQCGLTKEPA